MVKSISVPIVLAFFVGHAHAQTNTFPTSGNVGIGTTSPGVPLHLKSIGSSSVWLGLDKNPGMETGIQFMKSGSVLFYMYSDNADDDGLKIQSASEYDATPRIFIPYNNSDLYLGLSGGNVAIGHKNPYPSSRLHIKAKLNTPWSLISESSSNDRIIGLSHDGENGKVSTSYLGNSGYSPLQLLTSNVARLSIAVDGSVGIGTTSPSGKFHVEQTSGNWNAGIRLSLMSKNWDIVADTDGDRLIIARNQNLAHGLMIYNGNVGIGSPNPTEKLTVNGTIYGKEVKVDLSVPGPDYVFEEEYNLPSLEELRAYIDLYKHLPEVPSAGEMETQGINVGEMSMILLKKIEELTLYVIQQNQNIEEIRMENKLQRDTIAELQDQVRQIRCQK